MRDLLLFFRGRICPFELPGKGLLLDLSGTNGRVSAKLRAVDCRDELKRPILYGNN